MTALPLINRVAIIGAGPLGLAAARVLLSEKAFTHISVFEQRSSVGGVWNHTPEHASISIPSIDPHSRETKTDDVYPSPVYDLLETNITKGLMCFPTHQFPRDALLFPPHAAVLQYLRAYAADLLPHIEFDTRVDDARKVDGAWQLTLATPTGSSTRVFDALVVANGHYTTPYVPALPGLASFAATHPDAVQHSKNFRHPAAYAGRKVLLVGNGVSGFDIAQQLLPHVAAPLLQSIRNPAATPPCSPQIRVVPTITAFAPQRRTVYFATGPPEHDVDVVLFATGYLHSHPWLHPPDPAAPLTTTGARVENLFHHIFYAPDPTLAFVGLPMKAIPFPVGHSQAVVVARAWSGRLALPGREAMRAWEAIEVEKKGAGRGFCVYGFPEDAEYMDLLAEWADEAREGCDGAMQPVRWSKKDRWIREHQPDIRRAFKAARAAGGAPVCEEDVGWGWKGQEAGEGTGEE
ncbi:hypothetical protein EDC01DRAFT_681011 [Geopyxis carbonaria]|nr:hypothetical protein EDC01DRAFT_681011 [Geopyxis carbonaria]